MATTWLTLGACAMPTPDGTYSMGLAYYGNGPIITSVPVQVCGGSSHAARRAQALKTPQCEQAEQLAGTTAPVQSSVAIDSMVEVVPKI